MAASSDFRTATYVPKLASDRKLALDRILMDFKCRNDDIRYIVHNGQDDICVLVERVSKINLVPYRPLNLYRLGSISQLKPSKRDGSNESDGDESNKPDEEGFIRQKKQSRKNLIKCAMKINIVY